MVKTWMPTIGGIISIIAGGLTLLFGILFSLAVALYFTSNYGFGPGEPRIPATIVLIFIFIPALAISVMAIIGGIYAIRRRIWGLALAGAICALLTIWAWPLGVASIVLIALSKFEFDHNVPNPLPTIISSPPSNVSPPSISPQP
jgi:hypothetical protein